MILPDKYVTLSESFIGLSGMLLDTLGKTNMTVDKLWNKFNDKYVTTKKISNIPTYQKYMYVLQFMYIADMINYNDKGEVFNENIKTCN